MILICVLTENAQPVTLSSPVQRFLRGRSVIILYPCGYRHWHFTYFPPLSFLKDITLESSKGSLANARSPGVWGFFLCFNQNHILVPIIHVVII